MKKNLVLDIETTGFHSQGGSIVEIGIVELMMDNIMPSRKSFTYKKKG